MHAQGAETAAETAAAESTATDGTAREGTTREGTTREGIAGEDTVEIVPVSLAPAAPAVPPAPAASPAPPVLAASPAPPLLAGPPAAPLAPAVPAAPPAAAASAARTGTPGAPLKSAAGVPVALAEPGMTGILGQDQVHRTWPAGTARSVLAGLQADPQLLWWARRAVVLVSVGAVMTFLTDWQIGLPVAAVAATADMLCHSRTRAVIPAAARVTSAQRQTRRRLARTAPSGYISIHQRAIPGTGAVVDHLVIGPAGVYAVSSQHWDRRLPVRATQGGQLYHGPFDQSGDLGNARWQAGQVSRLVGDALGQPVAVRAAMVIYGPTVPWVVIKVGGVDVFCGRRLRRYLRREACANRTRRLDERQIELIHAAAAQTLPPAG